MNTHFKESTLFAGTAVEPTMKMTNGEETKEHKKRVAELERIWYMLNQLERLALRIAYNTILAPPESEILTRLYRTFCDVEAMMINICSR